jgi:cephalosporin hydroxylase
MSDDPVTSFARESEDDIRRMVADDDIRRKTLEWICATAKYKYTYHFTWMGRPTIQFPQDLFAIQEIIWRVRPELVVETGVAHGGSLIFYASMLELLGGEGIAIGVDIEIRPHNRRAIEGHPLAKRVRLVEGSSTDLAVAEEVTRLAGSRRRALVILDSHHEHTHVLRELELYSPMVTVGSYVVVCDTIVDDMPAEFFANRPWGPGNNPKTAVKAFLGTTDRFTIDKAMEEKLLLTVAPDGYLKCIKDRP